MCMDACWRVCMALVVEFIGSEFIGSSISDTFMIAHETRSLQDFLYVL